MQVTYNVQNSPVVADISLLARQLSIVGSPTMSYPSITPSPVITRSQPERVAVKTVTIVLANNTAYTFTVSQLISGVVKQATVSFVSSSVATTNTTEITTALKNILDAFGFQLSVVISSVTLLTITANTGYPLFNMTNITPANTTIADAMPTIAPSGTANLAITSVIAPHGTAATAIAGTTTVTVTTLAAHGLVVGDQVTIAGVATMTINGGSSGTFYVATVPTSTTFTLASCIGSGTNTGTITINTVNTVIVNTLAANGLSVGDHVTIAGIATMTVNGAASFTGRVRTVVSTTQFYIDQTTNNGSLNSGTITITTVAQTSAGLGTSLSTISGIVGANSYTLFDFTFGEAANPEQGSIVRNLAEEHRLYVNEGASTYAAYYTRLIEKINGYQAFSTTFDPETVTL